jgi:hypothetical protein
VSYFAIQTKFVTLVQKHFIVRDALGSENTPGWLTEANIYFNNVVDHRP